MAPRPNRKIFLKLSSATTTSQHIRFFIINRSTGNRIHI
jgi:non-homologous end joining protein Ku